MKKLREVIVERLNKYIEINKLTQYKLSQLSGVPFSTIKSIMQRKTKDISLKTLIMLCDGLNISPSEFLNDSSFNAQNIDLD